MFYATVEQMVTVEIELHLNLCQGWLGVRYFLFWQSKSKIHMKYEYLDYKL